MKKITFLMLHLNYGGLEKQTITLINELAKTKKYDISIISVYDLLYKKSFYEIDENVKVTFLANFGPDHKEIKEAKKNKNILKMIKFLFLGIKCLWYKKHVLKNAIKKLDTDIIFSTRIEFSKLIKRKDTLNISQEHSYITTEKYINLVKNSFRYINYIVVMTNKAKQDYTAWLSGFNSYSKVICIPNMIYNTNGQISNLNPKQIISIGRLEEEKDFSTLIEVFNIVNKELPDVNLKIVGDGSKRSELEEKVNKLNLENNIIFTGKLSSEQLKKEILNSSICISTSLTESFSLVLVEAMSLGVPVISFDIDAGPREIIEDGGNGFLIENRDISMMAEKIVMLLKSSETLNSMASTAIQNSKKYFSENIIKMWEDIL